MIGEMSGQIFSRLITNMHIRMYRIPSSIPLELRLVKAGLH